VVAVSLKEKVQHTHTKEAAAEILGISVKTL